MTTLMFWETLESCITTEGINVLITGLIVTKLMKKNKISLGTMKRPWPV